GKQGWGLGASLEVTQCIHPLSEYKVQDWHLHKIHKAALAGDVAQVQQILSQKEDALNCLDKKKRTALHLACANGHEEVVTLLAERKCELDVRDGRDKTALIMVYSRELWRALHTEAILSYPPS
ncbi:putative ankyrin repeat domain-containing protein 26-like protein, partial [Tupaia chinensis]|uniref:putative ankyrin repeat domain-containing protein 26-like protein n=1 Tax=Tupaia chinensis TaxID=246437 RepID=UPI00070448D1